jgi:hypothetical protein
LRTTLTGRHELLTSHPLLHLLLLSLRTRCTTSAGAGLRPSLRCLDCLVQPLSLLTRNEPLILGVRLIPDLLAHLLRLLGLLLLGLGLRSQRKTKRRSGDSRNFEHSHQM